MLVFINENETYHKPSFEFDDEKIIDYLEVRERVDVILKSLKLAGFPTQEADIIEPYLLTEVHTEPYIKYLQSTENIEDNNIPDVYTYQELGDNKLIPEVLQGYFAFDDGSPLTPKTWQSVLASASCAYRAAEYVKNTQTNAYALCRPPGHHALPDKMGGFCYLNNACIAANYLSKYGQVLLLDIDYHHGNGSQHIIKGKKNLFYLSLHADPDKNYPYFSGRISENGSNIKNVPLEKNCGFAHYIDELTVAIGDVLTKIDPVYLVISGGVDTLADDPEGNFNLQIEDLEKIGTFLKETLDIPTLIVQEGGYNLETLGAGVTSLLKGFI